MRSRVLFLLGFSACSADKGLIDSTLDTQDSPQDLDGDGYTLADDCEDEDPSIHPGAAEICDGIDQDCDGEADQGIPHDGAGCENPGMPYFPEIIDIIHLQIRTAVTDYAGTDDGAIEICLSESLCLDPYKYEWNDFEAGIIDVYTIEGVEVERSSLDRFQIGTSDGDDRWEPSSFQVLLDGESIYCNDSLDFHIGDQSDELSSWTDPEGLSNQCSRIFDSHITHGPIVGAVEPDRARIWYRSDATRQVILRVAESESALEEALPVHYGYPLASHDFTMTVEVLGLAPSSAWFYDLEVEAERLGPWSFHTAPEEDSSGSSRFAFGSCSKYDDQPAFGAISAWDPDFFLFVGDNHYGNTSELSDLRQFYRWSHERNMRAQMMAEVPTLAIWDDHDYTGNNTDGSASDKATALRIFEEYWANPGYGTESIAGIFFEWSWGDVDFFMLDDRYWRGLEDSIIGSEQTSWLIEALERSDGVFKILVSGSQWTSDGSSDSWAAFPEAREAFFEQIRDAEITGVVLLSGDVHRSELRLLEGASASYDLPELTSSPLSNATSPCSSTGDELLSCYDDEPSWVGVEIDTSLADPVLLAIIHDEVGNPIEQLQISVSELDFD